MSSQVNSDIKVIEVKEMHSRQKTKDKNDRATVDNVLDPRTLAIWHKWLKAGTISEIFGCISTGKEANVYHAFKEARGDKPSDESELEVVLEPERDYAIKVFKTSILVFKDRQRYVEGEFRFRNQAQMKSNPRKMVKQWAEKEVRNLKRVRQAGILAPEPILQRNNVILMEFIGN